MQPNVVYGETAGVEQKVSSNKVDESDPEPQPHSTRKISIL